MKSPVTFDEYLAEEMKNPAFKAEWDALEPEFQIIRAIIEGREARLNGYQGRNGWDVLSDMREAISSKV